MTKLYPGFLVAIFDGEHTGYTGRVCVRTEDEKHVKVTGDNFSTSIQNKSATFNGSTSVACTKKINRNNLVLFDWIIPPSSHFMGTFINSFRDIILTEMRKHYDSSKEYQDLLKRLFDIVVRAQTRNIEFDIGWQCEFWPLYVLAFAPKVNIYSDPMITKYNKKKKKNYHLK